MFSMTGNIMDPFIENNSDDLLAAYVNTLKKVELSLPVNFTPLVKHTCEMARMDMEIGENKNYYVLILVMAGLMDDFDSCVQEIMKAADLPLSVIFVKVGNSTSDNDQLKLIEKAMEHFKKSERQFIDLINYGSYKQKEAKSVAFQAAL